MYVHYKYRTMYKVNPIRTGGEGGGVFSNRFEIFANNFGSNKGTLSKLSDFSQNLTPNKVKVTNFQN